MFAIGNLFLSVVWAVITTIALLGILHFLMKSLFPLHGLNPGVVIVMLVVAGCVFWQSVRLFGALYLKGYVGDISELVSGFSENGKQLINQETYTLNDLENIKQEFSGQYPFVKEYIDKIDLKTLNNKGFADAVEIVIYKQLNLYVWARAGWTTACMFVAFGALYYAYSVSVPKKRRTSSRRRDYDWD